VPTAYKVVRDCQKLEKHWCSGIGGPFPRSKAWPGCETDNSCCENGVDGTGLGSCQS
jgi:hypothetical protein